MILVEIERIQRNNLCIAGNVKVYENDEVIFECLSLENPEIGTERQKDLAVPDGEYILDRRFSPRFSPRFDNKEMFWIYNDVIPKDAYILFHGGNTERDTEGCILLGSNFTRDGERITGLGYDNKASTCKKFMSLLETKDLEGAKVRIINNF